MARRAPCYDCTQHTAECHARCEAYAAWARRLRERRAAARAGMDADGFMVDQQYRRKREWRERSGN